MNISKILKYYRLKQNISQATLADNLGFSHRSSVHRLETGQIEWKFANVAKACELLGLEIRIERKKDVISN